MAAGGGSPDELNQVMLPIIDREVCNQPNWYNGAIDDSMVCAGYAEGGRDTCQVSTMSDFTSFFNSLSNFE